MSSNQFELIDFNNDNSDSDFHLRNKSFMSLHWPQQREQVQINLKLGKYH